MSTESISLRGVIDLGVHLAGKEKMTVLSQVFCPVIQSLRTRRVGGRKGNARKVLDAHDGLHRLGRCVADCVALLGRREWPRTLARVPERLFVVLGCVRERRDWVQLLVRQPNNFMRRKEEGGGGGEGGTNGSL